MKQCSTIHAKIIDYAEGKLSDEDRTAMEHHLVHCAEAREFHRQLVLSLRLIESDRITTVGDDFIAKTLQTIDGQTPTKTIPWWTMAYRAGVAAAVIAAIVVGVRLGNQYVTRQNSATSNNMATIQSDHLLADVEQEQYEAVLYDTEE